MKELTMKLLVLPLALLLFAQAHAQTRITSEPPTQARKGHGLIERGRYLVKTTGCNDCHTAGYTQTGGKTPEKDWLQGDALGWQGPWGTTYARNLRLHFSRLSEQQWLQQARTMQARPPMPWFSLRDMSDADLKAIYAYIRAAGPAGQAAPAYLPPGAPTPGPVIRFPG
jgi:mono/diheme cytochrome c family protein